MKQFLQRKERVQSYRLGVIVASVSINVSTSRNEVTVAANVIAPFISIFDLQMFYCLDCQSFFVCQILRFLQGLFLLVFEIAVAASSSHLH